jgi:hypothetical protein
MAPESISAAYIMVSPHQFVYMHVHPLIVATQRVGKNVPTATDTQATDVFDVSISMRSVSHQTNTGDQFIPEVDEKAILWPGPKPVV